MTDLTMFKKSLASVGVKMYNHLPGDIKDLAYDIKSFKKSTKNICLSIRFIQ
jgi:hypothetical protein